jgi:hypothetical protein
MKLNKTFITLGVAGALAVGGTTAAFAAGGGGQGTPTGQKATFVCAHLDEINGQLSLRHQLLEGRLTLLNEAKAEGAAGPKVDVRIARTNAAIAKNEARTAKLAEWAPAHCTANG